MKKKLFFFALYAMGSMIIPMLAFDTLNLFTGLLVGANIAVSFSLCFYYSLIKNY